MPLPRRQLISPATTPYYHITSRCVRQQFLCGFDRATGRDFSHRKDWIRERFRRAASAFAIDIHAYAVMSNHFHLVIELRPSEVERWSDREVIHRWRRVFRGPPLLERFLKSQVVTRGERATIHRLVAAYRERLASVSWFMRAINEPIARMANQEDNVNGHFWSSRYRSQALLTAGALLAAMAYVDLNPVRAGMAQTPETSDYTSIQERIQQRRRASRHLAPLTAPGRTESECLCSLDEYLMLVDWSGRSLVSGKRGAIPEHLPDLMVRLGLRQDGFLRALSEPGKLSPRWLGSASVLRRTAARLGRRFLKGGTITSELFSAGEDRWSQARS